MIGVHFAPQTKEGGTCVCWNGFLLWHHYLLWPRPPASEPKFEFLVTEALIGGLDVGGNGPCGHELFYVGTIFPSVISPNSRNSRSVRVSSGPSVPRLHTASPFPRGAKLQSHNLIWSTVQWFPRGVHNPKPVPEIIILVGNMKTKGKLGVISSDQDPCLIKAAEKRIPDFT